MVKLLYFSDRDDVERTIWDPEGAEDSTVSEQRKPFCNSGLTWQMDLGTEPTYLRPQDKSGQKNTAYVTRILQLVAKLSLFITFTWNGKRLGALGEKK